MCKEKYINPFTDFTEAQIHAFSKEERIAYEQSLKAYRDYNNTLRTAEWMGEERGREEGREEGRVEGREEGKREMALKMLQMDMDINVISSVSGIPVDELKHLKSF